MLVEVFHTTNTRDAGWEPTTEVIKVAEFTIDATDPIRACDLAFMLFNVGHEPEFMNDKPDQRAIDYRARGNRSLMIGDVVAVDGVFYDLTRRDGWTRRAAAPQISTTAIELSTPFDTDVSPERTGR